MIKNRNKNVLLCSLHICTKAVCMKKSSLSPLFLRNIASDIKNGKTQQYPSNLETVGCFLNVCSQSFYNSNTDADARLIQAGITPPNTNTKNGSVPGGLYDRQNALKQLADSLKQLIK